MEFWASRRPLGVPVHPWITKMGPRVPKMEPQGVQNHGFGCLVTPKSSTRVPKPPKENRTEQPKRKELQQKHASHLSSPNAGKTLRCGGVASAFSISVEFKTPQGLANLKPCLALGCFWVRIRSILKRLILPQGQEGALQIHGPWNKHKYTSWKISILGRTMS